MSIEEVRCAPPVQSEPDLTKINSYLDCLLEELSSISKEIKGLSTDA
jgi:hypothetical protein